ncbi:response regulator [bacterium]|nr:response regulator [bacterium]
MSDALRDRPRPVVNVRIVDDEQVLADTLAEFLTAEGHEVRVAYDAASALRKLAEFETEVVLCDIQLPGTSGLELLRKLRKQAPEAAVIMITAYATVDSAVEAFRHGATDYLIKPVLFDDLTARLSRISAGRALSIENQSLRRKLTRQMQSASGGIETIVGNSAAISAVKAWIVRVAPTRSNVLVTGESGTGKELAARAIHDLGSNPEAPFLPINCAAIPPDLLENQLFGHVRGAFTGADRDRAGLFVAAGEGTVFLDEIGEMPLTLQAKLLRAIENREILPVGASLPEKNRSRLVAATNKNLADEVTQGKFRPDLYYRLEVVTIPMPPLRERREDIPALVEALLARHAHRLGQVPRTVAPEALERLIAAPWPGNVRELDNLLERALILADGPVLTSSDLFRSFGRNAIASSDEPETTTTDDLREAIRAFEKRHLKRILAESGDDRRAAASRLGLGLSSLYARIKEHGL